MRRIAPQHNVSAAHQKQAVFRESEQPCRKHWACCDAASAQTGGVKKGARCMQVSIALKSFRG